jgi:uncharacterized protein (DUF1697 family)
MSRHIAFLRAINVGGHTVKMDRLRALFAEMGFVNVETFIASGNVIFDSPRTDTDALERTIEDSLQAALGYRVDVFIRSPAELAAVAARRPFAAADLESLHTLFVAFLGKPPDEAARARIVALATAVDAFHVDGREVYWLRRDGLGESAITGGVIEKALGQPATVRNARTVERMTAKFSP